METAQPATAAIPQADAAQQKTHRWWRVLGALSSFQRLTYTRTAVVMGFAAGLLLSPRLWISSRDYPLVPIVHHLPRIAFPVDYLCAAALFFSLGSIAVTARPRSLIFGFAALLVFLALYDQTRWQPWAYLYLFLLLSLSCFSWKPDDLAGQQNTLNICRLIIAATYFYSGLQKLNLHFAEVGMISLLGPRAAHLPLVHVWPWILGGVEASLGIALLTPRLRNLAVLGGLAMHSLILFSCIVVIHWNSVVWPWNIAMMSFLVLLFWKADFDVAGVLWRNPLRFQKVALLLFGVMPLLSFFGWWDSYLSASLYSANIDQANIIFRGDVKAHLPPRVRRYVTDIPAATSVLNIRDWAIGELNVPPYPAKRALRAVGQEVCRWSNNSPDLMLVMRDRDTLLAKGAKTQDTCLGTLMVKKW
jgi:uncharacterized membrane protein YphA (DoxX/SURF4 family)